ncbi:MAG TPA: cohesin domain-containing protein [Bacteroidales bacterium]|nr:cohesin domain-containing protein [Bacteroidales bacterium]
MKKHKILFFLLLLMWSSGWLTAQTIAMRIPDTVVTSGIQIDIPVYVDSSLTGQNVMSYMLQVAFNPAYLQPVSIIVSGTLSAPFGSPAVNTSVPGVITMAAAGTAPLTGAGKFIYIRFLALQPGGTDISFTGTAGNYFNEGSPEMTFDGGYINIYAPPSITVFPDNGIIANGEQLQFNVNNGAPSFQWFVTNSSVAAIDATGLLTATQAGFTRVVAQDNNAIRDTTNFIEIRAMRLNIPDNLSQWQGTDIDIPVNVTDLTGLNILSGNFAFTYNQNILTPIGIVQAGSLLASYPSPVFNSSTPGYFSLAFAGTTPLDGSGTLIYVRFHVSNLNSGATEINFVNGLFNETLVPAFTNGYFTTIDLPVLSVLPYSGYLVAGETQQFTVGGGGIMPFAWNVSDTNAVSISQSGLLTAKRSGLVYISVTDSLGATATSGAFQIFDTRVIMPDTMVCLETTIYSYPVQIGSLPSGESVQSIQGILNYDTTYFSFLDIESSGTLTQGWTFVKNPSAGQVIFAGSGSSPFNSAGTILLFEFAVKPAFNNGNNTFLNLHNVVLNEGIPLPLVDGYADITGAARPSTPVVGTIVQPDCTEALGSVDLSGLPPDNWLINPGNTTGSGINTTIFLAAGTYNLTVTDGSGCASEPTANVVINPQPIPMAPIVGTIIQPTCIVQTGSVLLSGLPLGNWTINPGNISGSTTSTTISGLTPGTYSYTVTNVSGCTSPASASVVISADSITTAEAGTTATYSGTPVQIGDANNGPGTITWSPAAGLSDPTIAQPLASPAATTTYTITVNNNGCVHTDTVTVIFVGSGHIIAGKTRYLKKATAGNPAPNPPTYNAVIYNIDNVEVKLKSSPGGAVLATTVSNANGVYQFTNVPDGNYILAYDHIPYPDTMQYVNHVNSVDLALLKYHVGHNPLSDPSRYFSDKHRRGANVDNNASINTVDIARISAKIGMPNDPARNFPKGNWVAFDTLVTVAGSDLNVTLQTVAYGDYDASSVKYQGATTNWGTAKVLPDENIIIRSDESIMMNDPEYFEVPLRISTKMDELSAVGLELSYSNEKYQLVTASMPNTGKTGGAIKINPTLEEIIAANNDLLVTDVDGVIRVVYATTDHLDIKANDELVRLGFLSLNDAGRGELDFNLNGTGLIANQYGEINEDAYLTMPRIFVQGDDTEAGFELAGYPNPFSDAATLTYNNPENGMVKLSVYNAIGDLVAVIVNEVQTGGKHLVVFTPNNLSYGMYTFKLEFTGLNESKCLVLKMIH